MGPQPLYKSLYVQVLVATLDVAKWTGDLDMARLQQGLDRLPPPQPAVGS